MLCAKCIARQTGGMRVAWNLQADSHLRPTHDKSLRALHQIDAAIGAG